MNDHPVPLSGGVSREPLSFDCDPLSVDAVGDRLISISLRELARVAVVAVETGARFQRELLPADPTTWLLSRRSSFGGRSALETSLSRDGCLRLLTMQGLAQALPDDREPAWRSLDRGIRTVL